jgi:hypothetical protein
MSGFDETRDDAAWDAAPGTATRDWELAAAAVELALLRRTASPLPSLPAALADRLGRDAAAHLPRPMAIAARRDLPARSGPAGGRSWRAAAGWLTAACLAGLLCWQWSGLGRIDAPPGGPLAPTTETRPSLAELRGRLLAEDPAALKVAWKKAGDDPAVVASKAQYQLWIFDAERNAAHPVDGGVFDVPAAADGEVVVRIDPRLPIRRATAFAITVEKPGGVVVSSRARLPLIAAVP